MRDKPSSSSFAIMLEYLMKLKLGGVQPLKRLGQNFLTDKTALKKVITAAELKPTDIILEIGPGTGILTQELAKRVKRVIAIEKDKRMVDILREEMKDFRNVKIIRGDILRIQNSNLKVQNDNSKLKIIGNLPFYLTAPVIRKFLEGKNPPKEMILIIQKEVAQRICAKPPDMNLLAVAVQFYAKPKIISYISKKSFWPQPKVDAAIIKIPRFPKSQIYDWISETNKSLFFKIVKAGFSQPRKQLINNLSKKLKINKDKVKNWLLENGVPPTQRAETLTVEDWIKLAKSS